MCACIHTYVGTYRTKLIMLGQTLFNVIRFTARVFSQAMVCMRGGKGEGEGNEMKYMSSTCARFSLRLLECWQNQSNLSIQSNGIIVVL